MLNDMWPKSTLVRLRPLTYDCLEVWRYAAEDMVSMQWTLREFANIFEATLLEVW